MIYPSIMAHILNGLLLFASLLFVVFYFKRIQTVDTYRILILLIISSIAVGIHGISHAILEKEYNFFPLDLANLYGRSL
jgi:phosphoglycerol transferase MdoB-like AlkP superfamily enzyme